MSGLDVFTCGCSGRRLGDSFSYNCIIYHHETGSNYGDKSNDELMRLVTAKDETILEQQKHIEALQHYIQTATSPTLDSVSTPTLHH